MSTRPKAPPAFNDAARKGEHSCAVVIDDVYDLAHTGGSLKRAWARLVSDNQLYAIMHANRKNICDDDLYSRLTRIKLTEQRKGRALGIVDPQGLSREEIAANVAHARAQGLRYVAVIDQHDYPLSDAVFTAQAVLAINDPMDIVRFVREHGLRPDAPKTTIRRLIDTQRDDMSFLHQYSMSPMKMLRVNLPADARESYERYLEKCEEIRSAKKVQPKGMLAKLLGRGRS